MSAEYKFLHSARPGECEEVCKFTTTTTNLHPLFIRTEHVGCLTSQQYASVSQGRICSDNFTCCHTEIEVADQTFHLTQSQYTDTGPTRSSTDPITPGAWQCNPLECQFLSHRYDSTPKKIPAQTGFESWIFRSRGGRLNH